MGCVSTVDTNIPSSISPENGKKLAHLSNYSHALNVNKKYEHLTKLDTTRSIGKGIRRTAAYEALLTKPEIDRERKQFWETRTAGDPNNWRAIKQACQQLNQDHAIDILNRLKLHPFNGSLQLCVDTKITKFNKYEVPVFCINEPIKYASEQLQNKNLQQNFTDEDIVIKIKSTYFPNDTVALNGSLSTQVANLKYDLKKNKGIPQDKSIRFFYNGRQMGDQNTLGNYKFVSQTVIQAHIK